MSKSVFLLVYETFAEFEVAVLLTALRGTDHSFATIGLSPAPVTSTGRLTLLPDVTIEAVDPETVDALVIPGGDAAHAMGNEHLRTLVRALDSRSALLAAICGGPAVLGDAGVLEHHRYTAALEPGDAAYAGIHGRGCREAELLVSDGNLVTAVGSAYLSFAEEVLRRLGDELAIEPLTYFRDPSLA